MAHAMLHATLFHATPFDDYVTADIYCLFAAAAAAADFSLRHIRCHC